VTKALSLVLRALVTGPARRRPMRFLLPALGVAVGVAAVAAIHHANRSVTESFRKAAAAVSGRSDLVVTGVRGVPLAALPALSFLWEAGSFAPAVTGFAVLDDGSGEVVEVLGIDYTADRSVREIRLVEPSGPSGRLRLAIRRAALLPVPFAKRHGLVVGGRVPLVAGGVRTSIEVGGLLALSGLARASGGDVLVTDIFTAQGLLGKEGYVDRVDITLDPGVSASSVRALLAARLPPGLSVASPGRTAATAGRMVRAFRFNLNALGSLTLVVGVFLIANAVSISVLRRRPEIATLRALGTSRRTIFAVFLGEGLVLGFLGAVLGVIGGLFLSRAALTAVARTVASVYIPTAKIASAGFAQPALLAATVGIAAALAATLLPAAQAARVAPSPAMRPGSAEAVYRRRLLPRALAAAAALFVAGLAAGLPSVDGFPFFGFTAVGLVIAALALLSPLLVRAVASLGGFLLPRFFGPSGRLATRFFGGALARNALAAAALAMALGMTLAMIVTVASIRETVRVWVESTLRADLWIKPVSGEGRGVIGDLPSEAVAFLRSFPGVAAVDPFRARDATDGRGRPFTIASGDFEVVARFGGLPLLDGSDPRVAAREARDKGEVFVSEPYARRFGAGKGDSVRLPTPGGDRVFRVRAVYRDFSNDRGTVVLDRGLYLLLFDDPRVTSLAVVAAPGTDVAALRRRLLAEAPYALSVKTNRELRREVLAIFDRTFAVTRALEAIAVAVAVLGIANALVASAVERRRSFGLLKAIGASAMQIRAAVFLEAVLTAATATLAAVPVGAAFAALLLLVINPQSFGWSVLPALPAAPLAGAVALVLGASLTAGIFPGHLAASVDPAAALAEE